MAWTTDITLIVRGIIGDLSTPQKYTDSSIQQNIAISSYLIKDELEFDDYTIDLTTPDITPDPTTRSPVDTDFVTLVALKSACLILGGEVKLAAEDSVKVVDGPSTIDLSGQAGKLGEVYNRVCKDYEKSKSQYLTYGAGSVRLAVTGPVYYNQR